MRGGKNKDSAFTHARTHTHLVSADERSGLRVEQVAEGRVGLARARLEVLQTTLQRLEVDVGVGAAQAQDRLKRGLGEEGATGDEKGGRGQQVRGDTGGAASVSGGVCVCEGGWGRELV